MNKREIDSTEKLVEYLESLKNVKKVFIDEDNNEPSLTIYVTLSFWERLKCVFSDKQKLAWIGYLLSECQDIVPAPIVLRIHLEL